MSKQEKGTKELFHLSQFIHANCNFQGVYNFIFVSWDYFSSKMYFLIYLWFFLPFKWNIFMWIFIWLRQVSYQGNISILASPITLNILTITWNFAWRAKYQRFVIKAIFQNFFLFLFLILYIHFFILKKRDMTVELFELIVDNFNYPGKSGTFFLHCTHLSLWVRFLFFFLAFLLGFSTENKEGMLLFPTRWLIQMKIFQNYAWVLTIPIFLSPT